MTAGIPVGGGIGNLFAGSKFDDYSSTYDYTYNHIIEPNDYFGRKVAMIASGVIVSIGGIIQSASFSAWQVTMTLFTTFIIP